MAAGKNQFFGGKLSAVGFGTGPFAGGFGDVAQQNANEAVKHAFETGINFFDTAPLYSSAQLRAEEVLGIALKPFPRESYILNTKTGRDRINGEAVFDYSPVATRASFEKSLLRLQVSYVDILTLHDVEFADDLEIVITQTIPELFKIKAEGKTRAVGISGYPLNVLLHIARRVKVDFVLTYAHLTIQNQLLEKYLADFEATGCAIINASPLCLGFFRAEGPPEFHFAPAAMKGLAPSLNEVCKKYNLNISQLATKFSMQSELAKSGRICNTLIGITSPVQVDEAVLSVKEFTEQEKLAVHEMQAILKPFMNYSWDSGHAKYKNLM